MASLSGLHALASTKTTPLMPSLFVGHGDPMNVISDNHFTQQWQRVGNDLPAARAILMVSAHWESPRTTVSVAPDPQTIYDFSGFPEVMYSVRYPALGAPEVAREVIQQVSSRKIAESTQWGFDHGTWCVLAKMLPRANIPVFQLSLGRDMNLRQHFDLAAQLSVLRRRGVMVMGSGNVVHNLRAMGDDYRSGRGEVLHDWAVEFDHTVSKHIEAGDYSALVQWDKLGSAARMAHPTIEHYLPLLYTLGSTEAQESPVFFAEGFEGGSFSMRSVIFS